MWLKANTQALALPAGLLLHHLLPRAIEVLCVSLVSLFLVFCCIPALHKPVRAVLRPLVVHHVDEGVWWVIQAQRLERPWLTTLFEHSAWTVSVPFYSSMLPAIFWAGLPELGLQLVTLMALSLYVGNAIKDLVCAPRPMALRSRRGAPQVRLLGRAFEEAELNAREYGLPSSHAMNSVCFNFYVVWYLLDRGLLASSTAGALYSAVLVWVLWIAVSRLYLGLHTPVDILSGALAGLTVVNSFAVLEKRLTAFSVTRSCATWVALAACTLLLRLHPRPLVYTPTYEYSTSFLGVFFGIQVGAARIWDRFHAPGVSVADAAARGWVLGAARMVVGYLVLAGAKELARAVVRVVLPQVYRLVPLRLRLLWQPPVHDQFRDAVESARSVYRASAVDCDAKRGEGDAGEAAEVDREPREPRASAKLDRSASSQTVLPNLDEGDQLARNSAGMPWDVDITARFFAYAGIGWGVSEGSAWAFHLLGLN